MFRVVVLVVVFSFISHFLASVLFPYALLINPHHSHYTIGAVSEKALHKHEENHTFSYNHEEEPTPEEPLNGLIVSIFENSPTFNLSFFNLGLATLPIVLTLWACWLYLFVLRPVYHRPLVIHHTPLLPPPR